MKDLKFRTPVKCQNGHKAFWYWNPKQSELLHIEASLCPEPKICDCIEDHPNGGNGGWLRDGDDQMFIGNFKEVGDIYEGDILKHPDGMTFLVRWDKSFSGFRGYYGPSCSETYSVLLQIGDRGMAKIIGSTHLTPELMPWK